MAMPFLNAVGVVLVNRLKEKEAWLAVICFPFNAEKTHVDVFGLSFMYLDKKMNKN